MILPIAVALYEGKEDTNERLIHYRVPILCEEGILDKEIGLLAQIIKTELREPIRAIAEKAHSELIHFERIEIL